MKTDVTNICIAICLVILGYYYGASSNSLITNDIFSLLGLIVSFCALIIAKEALGTWKNQFKHQLQHKALVNAEIYFKDYCASEEKFRIECIKRRSEEQSTDFDIPNDLSDIRNTLKREYQRAWNELAITGLDLVENNQNFAPDEISKSYFIFAVEVHDENFCASKSSFYDVHESNLKKGVEMFIKYRKKLS